MALVSIAPLVSKSAPHRSLISSANIHTALCRPSSAIGMFRPKKIVTPTTRMSFTVAVDDGQRRRKGDHHSNIWDDDAIHSLSTSYGAPAHRQRSETLIEEIKLLLLGDMKESCTNVVLENFKDENGQFCNSSGEEGGGGADKLVRSMLSLFRASNISFPGEKVMDEAKAFTTEYLNQVLTGQALTEIDQSLLGEVKYALDFPWYCSVPRWEARNFIEIYEQNDSWLKY